MRKNFKFNLRDHVESIDFKGIPFEIIKRMFIGSSEGIDEEYLLKRLESTDLLLTEKVNKLKHYYKMNILSIDGGGIRGLVALCILKKIEIAYKKTIPEIYDLIVGTSTGGIIACGYGKNLSTDQMICLYLDNAEKIFGRDLRWKIKSAWGVINSKYNGDGLYEVLFDYFKGDLLLTSKVRVITTSYNTITQNLFLFDSQDMNQYTFLDACLATSAAPTYFPPYIINDNEQYLDGGIYAANPSFIGNIEGLKSVQPYYLTSVGTGHFPYKPYRTNNWGVKDFLIKYNTSPLLNMVMKGSKQMISYGINRIGFDVYNINLPFQVLIDESDKTKLLNMINYCINYKMDIKVRNNEN